MTSVRFQSLSEWLSWQETLHSKTIDLGLSRIQKVASRLGIDRRPESFTFTVGGTNGKGSSVAMLTAVLRAAGYCVGTYTSPHLLRYNERIRVNGKPVADQDLCASFARIDDARGDITLSFFEFGTLAALEIFARAGVEVQVLEVGLGGRLDAVNLVDANVAMIASIDLDHEEWLGNDREAIGREKAGIFRRNQSAIVADPQVPKSVTAYGNELEVDLKLLGRDFYYRQNDADCWDWSHGEFSLKNLPMPGMMGDHQLQNASGVLAALHAAAPELSISEASIRNGLVSARATGRLQYLDGAPPTLFDVAHNPQSVAILADHLRRHFPGKRIHAVFSVMRDKAFERMLESVVSLVEKWYLAPLPMPRATDPTALAQCLRDLGAGNLTDGFADAEGAYRSAMRSGSADLVLVFGSFYLVAECLRAAGFREE